MELRWVGFVKLVHKLRLDTIHHKAGEDKRAWVPRLGVDPTEVNPLPACRVDEELRCESSPIPTTNY